MITIEHSTVDLGYGIKLEVTYEVADAERDVGFAGDLAIIRAEIGGVTVKLTPEQYSEIEQELWESR